MGKDVWSVTLTSFSAINTIIYTVLLIENGETIGNGTPPDIFGN